MKERKNSTRLRGVLLSLYRYSPKRIGVLFVLLLSQAATSGIGLLFLLPLLHAAGLPAGSGDGSGWGGAVVRAISRTGFPLRLETLLLAYVLLVGAIAWLNYATSVLSAQLQHGFTRYWRDGLYRSLLRCRWEFILGRRSSDFTYTLGNQVQTLGMAAQSALSLASRAVVLAALTSVAMLLSWRMSLIALAFAVLALAVLRPVNKRIHGSGRRQVIHFKVIFQMLTEHLASLKMIKSYSGENRYAGQLASAGEALELQNVRMIRMQALSKGIYAMLAVAAFSGFAYVGLARLALPMPTFLVLLLVFSRVLSQLANLQTTWQQLLHQLPAFEDIDEVSRACAEAEEREAEDASGGPVLTDCLELKGLAYRYPGGNRDVLRNFSATIRRNRITALAGPSGAGKSTLADLIAGLLEPCEGSILCDGAPLEGSRRQSWRRSLAYVTQEVHLFHDTVRANLEWVAEGAGEARIWEALRQAAADDFVAALPAGLDTVVGDRGIRLSGGERQRLALARALLTHPQMLILDEATSALDRDTEDKIQLALERLRGRLTILLIAHREGTLEQANERIVLTATANEVSLPFPDAEKARGESLVPRFGEESGFAKQLSPRSRFPA